MSHDKKPERLQLSDASLEQIKALRKTTYYQHIKQMGKQIKDKVVLDSQTDHTGYLLKFTDKTQLLCSLVNDHRDWKIGDKFPAAKDLALLHNTQYVSGQEPINASIPYADEENDIKRATLQAHGKSISGVSIGQRDFGICFPDGYELEAHVFTHDDQTVLRVFWEKW